MKKYMTDKIGEIHMTNEGYEALIIDGGLKPSNVTIQIKDYVTEKGYRAVKQGSVRYFGKYKKYTKHHIGKTFKTRQGYDGVVIDGGSKKGCIVVKIKDWTREVEAKHAWNGSIRYPYHPTICNIGYIGEGTYTTTINGPDSKKYNDWSNMLTRCYDEKYQKIQPTYIGAIICEEWHNFQTFAKWHNNNYVERFHLDKDLLNNENKIYSSDTCIYIPQALNSFLANKLKTNKSGNIGVFFAKECTKNPWHASISIDNKIKNLGYFSTENKAIKAYSEARETEANKWKEKMKNILPQKALDNIK